MTELEHILNELGSISPTVAAVPRRNVFAVPDGYFDNIYPELQARISADKFYAKNAFTVPEGYFESLESSIMERIKSAENDTAKEEIASLSPLIAGIGNKNTFSVPQGYFEELNFVPQTNEPAKIIQMNPRSHSIFRYAAAAVITGLLGISVINVVNDKPAAQKEISVQFASVENLQKADAILKTGTLETELASLSKDDIDAYLSQEGQDVNAAMVAASVDNASTLPEVTDYIFDENTLDNYLKENNLKN